MKKESSYSTKEEVEKFSNLANDWWNPNGKMKPLHKFNPVRVSYIKNKICEMFDKDANEDAPLSGLKILDVGCGGGLLSESLAILGADVVGIDATEKMIEIAKIHSKESNLNIDYRNQDVKEISDSDERFDVVLSLEVVEHVSDPDGFLKICSSCVKDNGAMFISTMNRTLKAYGLAIVGAEYILRWLPKGTHDWHKFLKPSEICHMVDDMKPYHMTGVTYNLFDDTWNENEKDLDVNYLIAFKK